MIERHKVLCLYRKMEEKYRNKYNVSSSRLAGWDYGADGSYFVTICTKDRERFFGEIEEVTMEMQNSETRSVACLTATEMGEIAFTNWAIIPKFHPYVELDEITVMPDHVHGILFINKPAKTTWEANKFGPQRNNLGSIIRGYKSSVKTYAVTNNIEFMWQSKYYDRVIRNEKEYWNIKEYIRNNPNQWYRSDADFENLFKP
jgi:putative transposase